MENQELFILILHVTKQTAKLHTYIQQKESHQMKRRFETS